MAECEVCGREITLPYECSGCGQTFCGDHRMPEEHDCRALNQWSSSAGDGRFDSGMDDSWNRDGTSRPRVEDPPVGTDPNGGWQAYFRNNVTYALLAAIWVTFLLQQIVLFTAGRILHDSLFVLNAVQLEYVWTWVTSIFSHSPINFAHIAFNSLVLFFFGPAVEKQIGSKKFLGLFLGAGVAAGLAQVLVGLFTTGGGAVLGASGAILAVMGVLTVLNPNMRVLLFFVVPMPLWVLTIGFAAFSVFIMLGGGVGAGGVAHLAHLVGLVIGLAYGQRLDAKGVGAPNQLQIGGGRRGGPGGPGGGRF